MRILIITKLLFVFLCLKAYGQIGPVQLKDLHVHTSTKIFEHALHLGLGSGIKIQENEFRLLMLINLGISSRQFFSFSSTKNGAIKGVGVEWQRKFTKSDKRLKLGISSGVYYRRYAEISESRYGKEHYDFALTGVQAAPTLSYRFGQKLDVIITVPYTLDFMRSYSADSWNIYTYGRALSFNIGFNKYF